MRSIPRREEMNVPSDVSRTQTRPLGQLSDVATNPNLDVTRESVANLAKQCVAPDAQSSRLALLDAAMIECRLVVQGLVPPDTLTDVTNGCAASSNLVPGLLYESIIHDNPLDSDPRTFTDGETGRSELLFYRVHREIEQMLACCIQQIQDCMSAPSAPSLTEAIRTGQAGAQTMRNGFHRLIHDLPQDHFNAFRGYFHNEHRDIPGPSALFSAGVFSFDTLVAGLESSMAEFLAFKERKLHFYPATNASQDIFSGREDMQRVRSLGVDLATLVRRSGEEALIHQYHVLSRDMSQARRHHLGVVKRFLPDVFRDDTSKGSGDITNVPEFLKRPMHVYDALKQEFNQSPSVT